MVEKGVYKLYKLAKIALDYGISMPSNGQGIWKFFEIHVES